MSKLYFILAICISLIISCTDKKTDFAVTVSNDQSFDRESELVELSIVDLEKCLKLEPDMVYLVVDQAGDTLVSQMTYDDKLIFESSLKANETKTFKIVTGKAKNFESQVFGRQYPERYDDFAWENDRVGFRFYGAKLKEVQAPTSGLDLWYKRTHNLVLDKWYSRDLSREASYHVDHGEGCDPYAVGQTLGGGSMGILVDSVLFLNDNYESCEVLETGPLRVTFKLTYPAMTIGDKSISETKLISLDKGSQLTKIVQTYGTEQETTVVAGFPLRSESDSALYTAGNNYFIYEEPYDEVNEQIFLGLIIPKGVDLVAVYDNVYDWSKAQSVKGLANVVAQTAYSSEGLTYYTGFGWTKFGFKTVADFKKYLDNYSKALENKLVVKYN